MHNHLHNSLAFGLIAYASLINDTICVFTSEEINVFIETATNNIKNRV